MQYGIYLAYVRPLGYPAIQPKNIPLSRLVYQFWQQSVHLPPLDPVERLTPLRISNFFNQTVCMFITISLGNTHYDDEKYIHRNVN